MRGVWPALLIACAVGCGGVPSEATPRDHVRAPLRAGNEPAIDLESWGVRPAIARMTIFLEDE